MDLLSGYGDSDDEEHSDNKRKLEDAQGEEMESIKRPKRAATVEESKEGEGAKVDKRTEEEEDDELPPLPEMFEANGDQAGYEDKSKHQGRVRTFKHVVGNYATYVHIPGKKREERIEREGLRNCEEERKKEEVRSYIYNLD